ncbi:MAG TPA: glycoside hydrolase family 19 protein [Steroidobacteraceae bacterium]|jgi:putative chitinase|nr:glycoside hydrolase family 19 protein [Steroidobacteraceae bacterium]
MTPDQLRQVMPYSAGKVADFAQPLTDAMAEFAIDTARRRAAFLAQVAQESGELRYMREIASGQAYEGRADLGNTQPGDGPLFRGGGLLMVTGRANFTSCGEALGVELASSPGLIETPSIACRSAAWFWSTHRLNELADGDNFGQITHFINGGYNGLDSRLRYWLVARKLENL